MPDWVDSACCPSPTTAAACDGLILVHVTEQGACEHTVCVLTYRTSIISDSAPDGRSVY